MSFFSYEWIYNIVNKIITYEIIIHINKNSYTNTFFWENKHIGSIVFY